MHVYSGTELYIGRRIQELEHVPEPLEFYRSYVSMNLPVVIRGAVKHWPAVHLWTSDYLRCVNESTCGYTWCCETLASCETLDLRLPQVC